MGTVVFTCKQRPKVSCYCPFKILSIAKTPGGKNIYNFKLLHAKNLPKIAEVKLSNCGPEVADFRKNCDSGIAELRLRSNISLKSSGIAIAEVHPSSCGVAIADSKQSCACPPLVTSKVFVYILNSSNY